MFRSQLFDHLQGVVFRASCCYYLLCLFASFIWYVAGMLSMLCVPDVLVCLFIYFIYLGTNLTNQNSIQEGSKCRLKSHNACYRLGQNPLSSSLLSKNIKIKVYRSTVFLLFCKGVKLGQNKKDQPAPTVNALSKLLHL